MEKGAYSPIVLDGELKRKDYDDRDRAFITAMFYGVIERRLTLDFVIAQFAVNPDSIDIETKALLRMAIYQIMFMDSVPDSAAVNESVKLSNVKSKGYVNAVLRNFLRDYNNSKDLINNQIDNDLSLKYSCPKWLIEKWQNEYGYDSMLQILTTSLGKPPVFESDGYVQDASSREACGILDPQSGETIIDVCAAPGGKSFTIAKLMNNHGRIISCDINRKKLKTLEQTALKLGLNIIETHVNDAKIFNADFPKAARVVCDVPCSGLGVIRRKPEIKYKPQSDFEGLPQIQLKILQTSCEYVKQGGVLMYSTCTLSRTENDDVVQAFLASNPSFELVQKQTIIPSEDGGDGFFTALLKRL